jgi:hypothetical protein
MDVDDTSPKSIDSLFINPHEAKLPPSWKWLLSVVAEEEITGEPITHTAVKHVLENDVELVSEDDFFFLREQSVL